jgi:hypothetical protein
MLLLAAALAGFLTAPDEAAAQSPQCVALEQELAAHMASRAGDPDQVRRFDIAIQRQTQALMQAEGQARQLGCDKRGFLFFQPKRDPRCPQVDQQIDAMRANLADLQRQRDVLTGRYEPDDPVRGRLLAALGRYQCGPQYQRYARQSRPNFSIFGDNRYGGEQVRRFDPVPGRRMLGDIPSFRTLCVRGCDGGYFPISFATLPQRFAEDARLCRAMCPSAQVELFVYQNPGATPQDAVSLNGVPYTSLPNANRYKSEVVPDCSCSATTLALQRREGLDATKPRSIENIDARPGEPGSDGTDTLDDAGLAQDATPAADTPETPETAEGTAALVPVPDALRDAVSEEFPQVSVPVGEPLTTIAPPFDPRTFEDTVREAIGQGGGAPFRGQSREASEPVLGPDPAR